MKIDLALNNLQWLTHHKTKPNKQLRHIFDDQTESPGK